MGKDSSELEAPQADAGLLTTGQRRPSTPQRTWALILSVLLAGLLYVELPRQAKPESTPVVAPPPINAPPCGRWCEAMPIGDITGWRQVFAEDFETDVALGHFPGRVYRDSWGAYRDGWRDTTGNGTYMPSKVLSVHNGLLDMFLHTEKGVHLVSAPFPRAPQGPYGKYSVRFRADALPGFKTAWLLWPDDERLPDDDEIGWPEGNLDEAMFARRRPIPPDDGEVTFHSSALYTDWHVATTTWEADKVTFELDRQVIGTSTTEVPDRPMHWVLQTETSTDPGVSPDNATQGHVQIDWAVVYKPTTVPPQAPQPGAQPPD